MILGQNSLEYSKDVGGEGYFEGIMVLPIDKPVKIIIMSEDVIHDFGIPAFRQKIDAVPGQYRSIWYKPTKIGTFDVFCDQYCGTNHSLMVGKVKVVSAEDYARWLEGTMTIVPERTRSMARLPTRAGALPKAELHQCHDQPRRRRRFWKTCT